MQNTFLFCHLQKVRFLWCRKLVLFSYRHICSHFKNAFKFKDKNVSLKFLQCTCSRIIKALGAKPVRAF